MKTKTLSLRRRHLLIAGMAGAVTPVSAFAGLCGGDAMGAPAQLPAIPGGDKLIVSGRIVDAACRPVSNATVEAWHADVHRTSVTTDGDGRFMFTTTTPGGRRSVDYRVVHGGGVTPVKQLHLSRVRGGGDEPVAQLQRDDAGVWRTTFGLTLA